MNTDEATQLLDRTFNNAFDIDQVSRFVTEVFNTIDIQYVEKTQYITNQYKDYISEVMKIGSYAKDKKKLEVLAVKLKKSSSMDRARTMQRNFIANWLNKMDIDAALVAFYDEESEDWRFSFVKIEYNLIRDKEGMVEIAKELTPAKRYSYLVGVNEPNHTCRSQFLNLVRDEEIQPSLSDIENAFSIEKITKEFFEKYKELVHDLGESVEKVIARDRRIQKEFEKCDIDTIDFSKKLLGQIVFLYFLQKKGWLGIGKDKNGEFGEWGTGPKNFLRQLYEGMYGSYDNFFNDVLEHLFYDALARPRDNDYYGRFNCKIPFLNGGLFEPIDDYDWTSTDILIDNEIFEKILGTFDEFNFTVKEDEPLEKEVAVDPEMLGKVFENLLGVKERKDKGAFYTPREIVHYMCQQSLINYLETNTSVSIRDIEKFIHLGDLTLANDQRILMELKSKQKKLALGDISPIIFEKEFNLLLDSFSLPRSIIEKKEIIDRLLQEIKIVDPTVGSGAFPMGMMNEIVKARNVLTIFFDPDEQVERNIYKLKRECIENSLYGVDIDPSAVEIAKLRFWLALIVDEEKKENIKPLPNLDHKIMCGNSLLEKFEGIKLFDDGLLKIEDTKSVQQYEIEKIKKQLESLYKLKGKIVLGREKSEKLQNVENNISSLERKRKRLLKPKTDKTSMTTLEEALHLRKRESQRKLKKLRKLHEGYFNEQSRDKKKALREDIDTLEWELIETTLEEQGHPEALQKLERYKRSQSKPFFLWKLQFAEIFQRENPGFDVVIANPPYIQLQKSHEISDSLTDVGYETFTKMGDVYCIFYEQSIRLLRLNGISVLITSNSWLRTKYGRLLRQYLLKYANPKLLLEFENVQIFETAIVETNIMIAKKQQWDRSLKAVVIKDDYNEYSSLWEYIRCNKIQLTNLNEKPWAITDKKTIELRNKIENRDETTLLKNLNVKIYFGIKTGYNKAFIINNEIKNDLINQCDKNARIIKPLLRGRDVSKYGHNFGNVWLINSHNGVKREGIPRINIPDDYPTIFDYLKQFESKLITRSDQGDHWSNLRNCAYLSAFDKEKIIWGELSDQPKFSLDDEGCYAEATLFIMTGEHLKFLLAILNSKLSEWYFNQISTSSGMGTTRWKKYQVEQMPIINTSEENKCLIEQIVQKILDFKKENKNTDTFEYEGQINQLIYKIYHLTEEEIKIVET